LISQPSLKFAIKKINFFQGRGVTTTKNLSKGEFVVEYAGDLIDVKVAKERETKYAMDLSKGCYMYYFRANNRQYW
jgi:histone-lysine N-methyltransferase SETD8